MRLRTILLWIWLFPVLCPAQSPDRLICNRIFSFAFEHKLVAKPVGEVMVAIGREFLHAPYEAHTLDQADPEKLVVNLRAFDCVTLVENILALTRCIKQNRLSYDAFLQELTALRYRNGEVRGYSSRLHYFSEWIRDNERKGIVADETKQLGGTPSRKSIDFMTAHRNAYPQLSDDQTFTAMRHIEDSLSVQEFYYIPKGRVRSASSGIQNGDIIAVTTAQAGLDISHTGIAVKTSDGSIHLLHAPNERGKIRITAEPLWVHLRNS
ncbi:MAG TPA: N-acetylmuramoyl-L-alanine amidase-like domain-containing protein, partial [Bacteroidota bacterium]|nr:N-acetylmuramoyl-L-alanine amidase-like domain-containing protein [Bacteroidota bacterium]